MQCNKNVKKSGFFNSNKAEIFNEGNNYELVGKGINLGNNDYAFANKGAFILNR
jgi:hypothetical protein